jgi:RNA polymerase sigma-70 factor (ECF subfamily)
VRNQTDEALIRLVQAKHRPALEELYDRYVKLVYSYAMKTAKEEKLTKEIVQAVFIRLWTTTASYRANDGQFVNWLLTITRNIAIDLHRQKRKNERLVSLDEGQGSMTDMDHRSSLPEEAAIKEEARSQIRRAIRNLTGSQAQLIEQMYWQGYTLKEIAEHTQEPIGTIKSRLHQALRILRIHLQPGEEG